MPCSTISTRNSGGFFTLGGMELSLDHLAKAGLAAGAFFVLRALGKYVAALVAMRVANAPETLQKNLGLALVPQAGVAVGLVITLESDTAFTEVAPEALALFTAVVLTVVVVNEVVGPFMTRFALRRSGGWTTAASAWLTSRKKTSSWISRPRP